MYSGGSIERSRVRSRLVDSKVLEFLLGLFSVTFNLEAEINTLPFVDSESTGAQMPSSSFETPTQSSSPLLPLECMIRTHSHAIMSTISSILTGSILANSRVTIWPGFLNDVLGLLVPKVNLPVKDEYQYFSVDEGDELIQISPDLVIRNLSVLESFIGLYGICTDTLRLRMLDYLEKLASGHEMNRVLMTQAGLVGIILKKVLHQIEGLEQLERFIKLLEVVGNYSISVAEAKYLFKCLRHYQTPQSSETDAPLHSSRSQSLNRSRSQSLTSLQTPTRMSRRASASLFDSRTNASRLPFYYDMLLKSVLKLFQRKEPDLDMFYFSGRNSGLLLPTFEKWPTSGSGYSFLCWIKIQEYPGSVTESNTGIHSSDRVIWSMRTGSGDGVELRISSNLIGLYVYKAGQEYSLIVSDILLLPKRWYFINVCHPGPKLPWFNEPEATIFMNGFGRATGKLPYPDMQMHTLNRIGATGISQPLETPTRRKFFGREAVSSDSIPDVGDNLTPGRSTTHGYGCTSSFCGQTTSMYLFEDILTLQQVQSLYDLGPGHCSQFKVEDLASYPDVGKVLFDGSLNSRIVLQFYPTATKQGSVSFACFDIGPRHSGDSEMRDVMACSSKCLQTSVHAFGGIEVMFPLLTHLNYPIESVPSVGFKLNPGAGAAVETPTIVRNARLTIFLQIISLLLGNDVAHMERFAAVQGPRVISMMLQQQNLSLVNMKSLDAIMALDKVASEVSLLSPAIAIPGSPLSSLSDEIQECLVFEYRIWAVTEGSVQLQHAEFLNHYLLANIDAHRSKYGVSFLLDTLEKYYWTVAPDYLNTDLQIKIMASRPDATFIFKIRSAILSALSDLILKGGGIRPDECHRLILSLWTCSNDSVHVLDLVNLMIDFCLGFASNAVLETFLANSGAMEILLHLIFKSEMEQIRISVLKLMLVLMKSNSGKMETKVKTGRIAEQFKCFFSVN
ncbi:hypothetical protein BC830DRAFT_786881 [Chytriomyces sp. MP71]|nr:hypothetical protein BC830DRAFT_786881 [Chytriomyces sp. MP71]